MASARPLRLAPEWDDRFTRGLGVSAVGHLLALIALVVLAERIGPRPLPPVAYTVEITDPSALGGRPPPGQPARDLSGGPTAEPKGEPESPPAPAPAATAPQPKPETPPAPAPKPEEPAVRLPDKTKPPEPKAVEVKPPAKPPEAKR